MLQFRWASPGTCGSRGCESRRGRTTDFFRPRRPFVEQCARLPRCSRSAGATIVDFKPPDVRQAMLNYFGLLSADGAADLRRTLGDDLRDPAKIDWRIRRMLRIAAVPAPLRKPVAAWLRLRGQARSAELFAAVGAISASRYWQLTAARAEYARRFMEALDRARIDACISPPHALPALRHGDTAQLPTAASYSMLPNLMNLPAGVVAATRIRAEEESDRLPSRDHVESAARAVEQGSRRAAGRRAGVCPAVARRCRAGGDGRLEDRFRQQPDYPAWPPPAAELTDTVGRSGG